MASEYRSHGKTKMLRVTNAKSRSGIRAKASGDTFSEVEKPQIIMKPKLTSSRPLLFRQEPTEDAVVAKLLQEVLAQEDTIVETWQEIERWQKELDDLPDDLATVLEQVLAQQDSAKEAADLPRLLKRKRIPETSRIEWDVSVVAKPSARDNEAQPEWTSLENSAKDDEKLPKQDVPKGVSSEDQPKQTQEVCELRQDSTPSPDENPAVIPQAWETQEIDLDVLFKGIYWGEDTTDDPFDDFEQSVKDMCTQEFDLGEVLREASLEQNKMVDFEGLFGKDAVVQTEMSAFTQEIDGIELSAQKNWDQVYATEGLAGQESISENASKRTQEISLSDYFVDATYIEHGGGLIDSGDPFGNISPSEEYRQENTLEDPYSAYPGEEYGATPYQNDYYQELPAEEFVKAEPRYLSFLPKWVKPYERCASAVFAIAVILLIFSAFVYMLDGSHGRQAFSFAYYPVSESVEAAQSNPGAERLVLANLRELPVIEVSQELLVRLNNLTALGGSIDTVYLLQTVVEINGEQYYTDQGYTLTKNMIQGRPMIGLPSWIRLFSSYFIPIMIISFGILLVLYLFKNLFLYEVYKKCRIQSGEYSEEEEQLKKQSKPKMILGFFLNAIFVVLVVLLIVLLGSGGQRSVLGYYYFSVLTTSMQADIPQGSLVLVKQVDPATIEVGDDITFLQEGEKIITHRVIEVLENYGANGERAFRTKGTANEMADPEVVFDANVLGKVVSHVEGLGATMLAIQKNALPIALILVGILVFIFLIKKALRVPTVEDEEEADAIEYGDDPYFGYPEDGVVDGVEPQPMWEQVSAQDAM